MKNRLLATLLALIFSATFTAALSAASDSYYPDVPEDAIYLDAVTALYDADVMNGDDLGNFNPEKTISRAEFAAVICRILDYEEEAGEPVEDCGFTDVPALHWSSGYIKKAAELGIVNGVGDGRFSYKNPVTIAQAAKMLVCAWGYGSEAESLGGWPDGYMQVAEDLGLLRNITKSAGDQATRAEVAMMTYELINVQSAEDSAE